MPLKFDSLIYGDSINEIENNNESISLKPINGTNEEGDNELLERKNKLNEIVKLCRKGTINSGLAFETHYYVTVEVFSYKFEKVDNEKNTLVIDGKYNDPDEVNKLNDLMLPNIREEIDRNQWELLKSFEIKKDENINLQTFWRNLCTQAGSDINTIIGMPDYKKKKDKDTIYLLSMYTGDSKTIEYEKMWRIYHMNSSIDNKYNQKIQIIPRYQLKEIPVEDTKSTSWLETGLKIGIPIAGLAVGAGLATLTYSCLKDIKYSFYVYDDEKQEWVIYKKISEDYAGNNVVTAPKLTSEDKDTNITFDERYIYPTYEGNSYKWTGKWTEITDFTGTGDTSRLSYADDGTATETIGFSFCRNFESAYFYAQYAPLNKTKLVFHTYDFSSNNWKTLSTICVSIDDCNTKKFFPQLIPDNKNYDSLRQYNYTVVTGDNSEDKDGEKPNTTYLFLKRWYKMASVIASTGDPTPDVDCLTWGSYEDDDEKNYKDDSTVNEVINYSDFITVPYNAQAFEDFSSNNNGKTVDDITQVIHFYALYRKESKVNAVFKTLSSLNSGYQVANIQSLYTSSDAVTPVQVSETSREIYNEEDGSHTVFTGNWTTKDLSTVKKVSDIVGLNISTDQLASITTVTDLDSNNKTVLATNQTYYAVYDTSYDVTFNVYDFDNKCWRLYGGLKSYTSSEKIIPGNGANETYTETGKDNPDIYTNHWAFDVDPDNDLQALLNYKDNNISSDNIKDFSTEEVTGTRSYDFYAIYTTENASEKDDDTVKATFYVYDFTNNKWITNNDAIDISSIESITVPESYSKYNNTKYTKNDETYAYLNKWVLNPENTSDDNIFNIDSINESDIIDFASGYSITNHNEPLKFYAVYEKIYAAEFYVYKDNSWNVLSNYTKFYSVNDTISKITLSDEDSSTYESVIRNIDSVDTTYYIANDWFRSDDNEPDLNSCFINAMQTDNKFTNDEKIVNNKTAKFYAMYTKCPTKHVEFYSYNINTGWTLICENDYETVKTDDDSKRPVPVELEDYSREFEDSKYNKYTFEDKWCRTCQTINSTYAGLDLGDDTTYSKDSIPCVKTSDDNTIKYYAVYSMKCFVQEISNFKNNQPRMTQTGITGYFDTALNKNHTAINSIVMSTSGTEDLSSFGITYTGGGKHTVTYVFGNETGECTANSDTVTITRTNKDSWISGAGSGTKKIVLTEAESGTKWTLKINRS